MEQTNTKDGEVQPAGDGWYHFTGQEVNPMEECSMTAKETARLIDWLISKGLTEKDATDCIKYIATGIQDNTTAPSDAE